MTSNKQVISYKKLIIAAIPMVVGIILMIVARLTRNADPSSWIKFFDLGDVGLVLSTIGILVLIPLYFSSNKNN